MSITSLEKDFDNLTLTFIMDFDYPVDASTAYADHVARAVVGTTGLPRNRLRT